MGILNLFRRDTNNNSLNTFQMGEVKLNRELSKLSREEMASDILKGYRDLLCDLFGSATKVERLLISIDKNNNASLLLCVGCPNKFEGAIVRPEGISLTGSDTSNQRLALTYKAAMKEIERIKNSIFYSQNDRSTVKRIANLDYSKERQLREQMQKKYEEALYYFEEYKKDIKKIAINKQKITDCWIEISDIMLKLFARRQKAYKRDKEKVDNGINSIILLKDGIVAWDIKERGYEEGSSLDVFKDGIKVSRNKLFKVGEQFFDERSDGNGPMSFQVMKESITRFEKFLERNPVNPLREPDIYNKRLASRHRILHKRVV